MKNLNLPKHIAIIMDGNGRWANTKGLPRIAGHRAGVKTVRKITELSGEMGVEILTLYTFSSENWNRPIIEVNALMKLLVASLRTEVKSLMQNNVKFTVIGEIKKLDETIQKEINNAIKKTEKNTGLNLNLALNYGSRQEILNATKNIIKKVELGKLNIKDIDEQKISNELYTNKIIDPDLLIRTGGEFRLSNFLLWQMAY
jgi:undecaprenyl diphosphate synthase